MSGNITVRELDSALSLNDDLKQKLTDYEKKNWAANISSPEVKKVWKKFIVRLSEAVKREKVSESDLISFIHFLSTVDTVLLLSQIDELDQGRKVRFLQLLNWVAEKSPEPSQRSNAQSVVNRILMAHRMESYPIVYSEERLAKALKVIQNTSELSN